MLPVPDGSRASQLGLGCGQAAASSACALCRPYWLPPLIHEAEYLQVGGRNGRCWLRQ